MGYEINENLAVEGMAATGVSSSSGTIFNTTVDLKVDSSYGVGLAYALSPSVALNVDYLYYYTKDGAVLKGSTFGVGFKF